MRWPWIGVLAVALVMGCRPPAPPPLPSVAPVLPAPTAPSPEFVALQEAAQKAEVASGDLALRTSFTPGQKSKLRGDLSSAVDQAVRATSGPIEFAYQPRRPFEKVPNQLGWRMIGRVLRWNLDAAIEKEDYEAAVTLALQTIRFGFTLTQGGATDASLGYAIVEDARRALLPEMAAMQSGTLERLSTGLEKALAEKPLVSRTLENEAVESLMAVQYVQDSYANRQLPELLKMLGPYAKAAVEYLQELESDKAPAYFQAFADDARKGTEILKSRAALPVIRRGEIEDLYPKKKPKPPYYRFALNFIGVAEPLLAINDRVETRFRLMTITTRLLAIRKKTRSVPKTLADFDSALKTDPFTGSELRFQSDGHDFRVYSVGADGRDDGGDTDDAFNAPDLTLEG